MREQKYRVWDIDNKVWLDEHEFFISSDGDVCENEAMSKQGNFIVCDYIGLRDKNDKDIYEGDILLQEYPDYDHEHKATCFDKLGKTTCQSTIKNYYLVSLGYSGDARYGWLWGDNSFMRDDEKLEVVGNIYENPELKPL